MLFRASSTFLLLSVRLAFAQTDIHSCDAAHDIQKIYTPTRNSPERVDVFREALKSHPDDIALTRWLLSSKDLPTGSLAGEYRAMLDAHPDNPVFLYFYAHALIGADTPKAIELINQALAKDPDLVVAYATLMEIYTSQSFRDAGKLTSALRSYVARCPQDVGIYRYLGDVRDTQALRELTPKCRYAVEHRNTVGVARVYMHLWTAEFRVADPGDFRKLREQGPTGHEAYTGNRSEQSRREPCTARGIPSSRRAGEGE